MEHSDSHTHTKENSYWIYDARGIPVKRVCYLCEEKVKATYRPEIFDDPSYPTEENPW